MYTDPSVVLPMWRGRRGVVNTIVCGVVGLFCAFAFLKFAERTAVVPACRAYATSHGLTYVDYTVYSSKRRASSACVFRTPKGGTEDVSLPDAASTFTDLWVGVAYSLEFTAPALILLFAVLLTKLSRGSIKSVA